MSRILAFKVMFVSYGPGRKRATWLVSAVGHGKGIVYVVLQVLGGRSISRYRLGASLQGESPSQNVVREGGEFA